MPNPSKNTSTPPRKPRLKTIKLRVDASTWRWVRALARANSKSGILLTPATAEAILEQAAFCFADAAGRRTGSWEASVGQSLLDSSGYQKTVEYPEFEICCRHDEREEAAWRADWQARKAREEAAKNGK